jgi:hypothetical protein
MTLRLPLRLNSLAAGDPIKSAARGRFRNFAVRRSTTMKAAFQEPNWRSLLVDAMKLDWRSYVVITFLLFVLI